MFQFLRSLFTSAPLPVYDPTRDPLVVMVDQRTLNIAETSLNSGVDPEKIRAILNQRATTAIGDALDVRAAIQVRYEALADGLASPK